MTWLLLCGLFESKVHLKPDVLDALVDLLCFLSVDL